MAGRRHLREPRILENLGNDPLRRAPVSQADRMSIGSRMQSVEAIAEFEPNPSLVVQRTGDSFSRARPGRDDDSSSRDDPSSEPACGSRLAARRADGTDENGDEDERAPALRVSERVGGKSKHSFRGSIAPQRPICGYGHYLRSTDRARPNKMTMRMSGRFR